MKREPIASSSIKSIGFDGDAMEIEFSNGKVYAYTGPKVKDHFEGISKAPSAGTYFSKNVRHCSQTRCELVSG